MHRHPARAGRPRHRAGQVAGRGHGPRVGHGVRRRHRRPGGAAGHRAGSGASLSGLQWTISGYTLALASLILLGGSLGDRYGRRRVFLVGVVWFAVASLFCGLAESTGQLVAARVLQGVGGALLTPGSLALIQSSFRPADRARAIGLWSALAGHRRADRPVPRRPAGRRRQLAAGVPVNVPVAALILAVAGRHVPESRDGGGHGRFDVLGAALGILALGGTTYALIAAGEDAPAARRPRGRRGRRSRPGSAFVVRERRAADPMLPLGLFADRQFTGANLATLAVYGALGGSSLFLVLQLQTVLGYDATAAGAAMLPAILLHHAALPHRRHAGRADRAAVADDRRAARRRGRHAAARGVDGGGPYVLEVLPGSLLQGLGMAITVTPADRDRPGRRPGRVRGIASGVNNAVARAAQLLAVAALPVAVGLSGDDYAQPLAFTAGYRMAMVVCAVAFAVGGAVSWWTIRNDVLAG